MDKIPLLCKMATGGDGKQRPKPEPKQDTKTKKK